MAEADTTLVLLALMSVVELSGAFTSDLQALYELGGLGGHQGGILGGRGALVRTARRHTPLRVSTGQDLGNMPTRHGSTGFGHDVAEVAEQLSALERRADDTADDLAAADDVTTVQSDLGDPGDPGDPDDDNNFLRNDDILETVRSKKSYAEEDAEADDDRDDDDLDDEDDVMDDGDVTGSVFRNGHPSQPFWHHPCGRSVDLVVRRPQGVKGRSSRTLPRRINKALERVWRQLNMTVLHYKLQRFDKLYYRVIIGVNEDNYVPSWVPDKEDLPKLTVEDMKSSHKLAHELTQMHTQLQKFSVALEQISEDNRLEDPLRHSALSKTKTYVKMLLCEVEWALLSLAIPLPLPVPPEIMSPAERNMTDDTNREIRDWGVLVKYRDFLHGWADIVAQAGRARSAKADVDEGVVDAKRTSRTLRSSAERAAREAKPGRGRGRGKH